VTETGLVHRLVGFGAFGLSVIFFTAVATLIWFEITTMRPVVSHARTLLAKAAHSELDPPQVLDRMLGRAHTEDRMACRAMSLVLRDQGFAAGMKMLRRQLTEAGVCFLASWHFSEMETKALFLSQSYMGPGVYGFSRAATQYIGVPLDRVDLMQAAKLVAIAHAPNLYLDNPERLNRRIDWLMSRGSAPH
jgi:hypothetical protein